MNKTVLLLADTCDDIYHMGHATRMNPEAPVPIFVEDHREIYKGMGFNVLRNLANLGIVDILNHLSKPSKKHRYVDIKSKYQLMRVDEDLNNEELMMSDIPFDEIFLSDAVVISDYDKGFITSELITEVSELCYGMGIPCFLDTKKTNISDFDRCIIKINEQEYYKALNHLDYHGQFPNLIVTLGEKGAMYRGTKYETKNVEVHDVTGAGDTFLAALTYRYLETKSIEESIPFANKAASITVQKFGTYAPTEKEIENVH